MEQEPQLKAKKISKRTLIIIIVLVVIIISAAAILYSVQYNRTLSWECGTNRVSESVAEYEKVLEEWDLYYDSASRTPSFQLPSTITDLREIREKFENVAHPTCLNDAHAIILKSMEYSIDAFTGFMREIADDYVYSRFYDGEDFMRAGKDKMNEVQECAPNCK